MTSRQIVELEYEGRRRSFQIASCCTELPISNGLTDAQKGIERLSLSGVCHGHDLWLVNWKTQVHWADPRPERLPTVRGLLLVLRLFLMRFD